MRLKVGAATSVGKVRPVNEDAFVVRPLPGDTGWLVVLADGQGGRVGGAWAAQLACQIAAASANVTDRVAGSSTSPIADTWLARRTPKRPSN